MWVDGPFFQLIEDFGAFQHYFLTQALFIGKIVVMINLGMMLIKYISKGSGLNEQMLKLSMQLIVFLIIFNIYPNMINGVMSIVNRWAVNAAGDKVNEMIQKTRGETDEAASDFWNLKSAQGKLDGAYSDIIAVYKEYNQHGYIGSRYVLDIFDKGSAGKRAGIYIRPNAVMRVLMLTFETIWFEVKKAAGISLKEKTDYIAHNTYDENGWIIDIEYEETTKDVEKFKIKEIDLPMLLVNLVSAAAVLICGILALLQYCICALEYTFITSVGCLFLPFMLWDGTKFLTEKLVSAIIGFTVKMLFVTLALMVTINGYLALMVRPYQGAIDQMIYTVFVSLFYMMICQNGPQLAVSLLTGSPQMSLGEGMAAVGAYAGAAIGAKKAASAGKNAVKGAAGSGAKAITQAKSSINKAQGASEAAKADAAKQGMGKKGIEAAGRKAAFKSSVQSVGDGIKSKFHSMGASLTKDKKGGGGGGGAGGGKGEAGNRFSTLERRNAPNEQGKRKTSKEFAEENKALGAQRYAEQKQKKQENDQRQWKAGLANKPRIPEGPKRYDGAQMMGQEAAARNPSNVKYDIPPAPPTPPPQPAAQRNNQSNRTKGSHKKKPKNNKPKYNRYKKKRRK